MTSIFGVESVRWFETGANSQRYGHVTKEAVFRQNLRVENSSSSRKPQIMTRPRLGLLLKKPLLAIPFTRQALIHTVQQTTST